MTDERWAMDADQIRESMRERLAELAPLVTEYVELAEADRKLTETFGRLEPAPASNPRLRAVSDPVVKTITDKLYAEERDPDAPFGYKADGTPRKRPAMTAEMQAKAAKTRARKRRAKRKAAKQQARLHVQTVTGPTSAEMEDREIRHVTAEPA